MVGWPKTTGSFQRHFELCNAARRGCRWCNHSCCTTFKKHMDALREWHRSMAAMPREAQYLEICNIFGGGCCSRVEVGRKTARSTSSTQTTSISAEAGEASENDTVATSVSPEPSPKRKACGSKMPLHQRAPPNKRSASSPGSSCQTTS